MLRRASSSLLRRVQQRGISSSSCRQWDQVRPHFHAGDHRNPLLNGQPLLGTDGGPDLLREAGLHKTLVDLGWSVEENGNLNFVAPSSNDPMLDPRFGKAKQCFPGLLSVHPDAGVIWVDAHADINTPADSDSGNMHGMPISFLMEGMVDSSKVPGFEWLANGPTMKPEQLVYVGLRDVDTFERRVIHEKGIKAFSMQEVDRYGIGKTMEMALDHLCGKKQRPLHVSYDIDAVDPLVAPSTGTRVRGGLTWREAHYVAEAVAETNLMVGLDMVEITVDMALMLISSALGNRIL
ncbi:Ureohydrolase domain [Phytophthora cactorum]|nr:Ureohydrolase domain [Phytophthora cactorum]